MTPTWGFLTNHALVLVYVVKHNDSTVREISQGVGVTERATLAILRQLRDEEIVERHRDGRCNRYAVNFDRLAAYRREGTVSLTPRTFVDALINVMLQMSEHAARENGARAKRVPPPAIDSGRLEPREGAWGFFTNHALLLLAIAMDPNSTVREMAANVGVTERALVALLNQLEDAGVIVRHRMGRRNTYSIDLEALRAFPRWSPGEWPLPTPLVEMAVNGLRALSAQAPPSLAAAQ